MLTLKHITPMGNESLYEAETVSYSPHHTPIKSAPGFQPSVGSLWYISRKDEYLELMDGTVYVMNDHGSTVAKYDLGGRALPQKYPNTYVHPADASGAIHVTEAS